MDRLKDPPTWLKVATTQEIDLQPWAPRQWTSTTTRWWCGLILLPSLSLRSPHPQGDHASEEIHIWVKTDHYQTTKNHSKAHTICVPFEKMCMHKISHLDGHIESNNIDIFMLSFHCEIKLRQLSSSEAQHCYWWGSPSDMILVVTVQPSDFSNVLTNNKTYKMFFVNLESCVLEQNKKCRFCC